MAYIKSYVNKSCRIAEIYSTLGDTENAVKTYEETEKKLGAKNENATKVYVEHLNMLYTTYEKAEQDPLKWSQAQKDSIIKVYKEGSDIPGITNNPTWIKRTPTVEVISSPVAKKEGE